MSAPAPAPDAREWRAFDAVYVINLVTRTDRRRQISVQLAALGLSPDNPRLTWIRAVKPSDGGTFGNIGARGCFLSHLECLRKACVTGHKRILILEDDALITDSAAWRDALTAIGAQPWNVWYGGARFFDYSPQTGGVLCPIDAHVSIGTTHCIGFQGDAIRSIFEFLELILTRPPGHEEAGPMPIDGAYTVWRRLNPSAITLASVPAVCTQRPSRSDITPGMWLDKLPIARQVVSVLRALRTPRP